MNHPYSARRRRAATVALVITLGWVFGWSCVLIARAYWLVRSP